MRWFLSWLCLPVNWLWLALTLTMVETLPILAQMPGTDPLQQIRSTLSSSDSSQREQILQRSIQGLRTLGDLCGVLLLHEWHDEDVDEELAAIDRRCRTLAAQCFQQMAYTALRQADESGRLEALQWITTLGMRQQELGSHNGLPRLFGPDLAQLVRQGTSPVRIATARALGQIHPDVETAVPALTELLNAQDVAQRVAAADGLLQLMKQSMPSSRTRDRPIDLAVVRRIVVHTGQAVIPAAARGLADAQPEVRRRSIEAIAQAVYGLYRLVVEARLTDDPRSSNERYRDEAQELADLRPLLLANSDQGQTLARSLGDSDLYVRLRALQILEGMASARESLQQRQLRPIITADARERAATDPLLAVLQQTLPALASVLTLPDVRSRRSAMAVLEAWGVEAATAASQVLRALGDSDRFVRWAAIRSLGRMASANPVGAVDGLTRMLRDPDPDLGRAALAALQAYGPAARENAFPTVMQMVHSGDAKTRVAALSTLKFIMPADRSIMSVFTAAMSDSDPQVRQCAAEALQRLQSVPQETSRPERQPFHPEYRPAPMPTVYGVPAGYPSAHDR